MVDDVTLPGSGARIATDDDGTRQYQWIKHAWGPDDVFNKVDIASGKPFPTQIRSATGAIPLGEPTDAAATATDTTSVSAISLWKQISKTLQAMVSSATTSMFTKITDGTTTAKVMAASTAPVAGDAGALLVAISPNGQNSNGQNTMANSAPVVIASNQTAIAVIPAGNVAHASADSGNPGKIGGRARSSEITAVTNDSRIDFVGDLTGKQIVLPYANPENFVSGATAVMSATTAVQLLPAPAAGLRNYITQITVSNAHATIGTEVEIRDGTTLMYTIPAAALYGGAVLTFPTPLRQPTTATVVNAAALTASTIKVSASGYKGA
jgi:hypothetical protein